MRRTAGYVAVDLPYLDSHLSMLIVMPSAGTLERFQRRLSTAALTALAGALAPRRLILRMPRFHLIAHRYLNAALAALGMPRRVHRSGRFLGHHRPGPAEDLRPSSTART